ncbi:Hypothetical protein PBC10988_25910 [Planctomycetales bacterium 10988]|nr:Hypothetical protein PBC10988_25910 [Planctomycetales bacterium 10988]
MEMGAVLVDWEEMLKIWSGEEPAWFECIDRGETWLATPSNTNEIENERINSAVGEMFWSLYDRLDEETFYKFGKFLTAFSLTLREEDEDEEFEAPLEIEFGDRQGLFVASALSPSTVLEYLDLREEINLNEILPLVELSIEESGVDIESADELKDFINAWTTILQEAKAIHRGLLVLILG